MLNDPAKRRALARPTPAVWLNQSVCQSVPSQGLVPALFAIEWEPLADVI
jgi:hypothetical protein